MNSSIRVNILGRDYTLRSQGSREQAEHVVSFVEEKLAEMATGKSVDTRDLTVLTLLNLAGQYLQLLEECEQARIQVVALEPLVKRLELALADDSGC
ncbi:cell division protein ZapA [Pelobacter seleniigenes]|uniref:cell division protein ZapA n=1 Tax=Pelobacter seleniigenes TaxID=407188 RepID=UPI0004A76208|nr:cell division protein ZapA [Pelobacter seleniigenes]